ncbi:CPBP family intramembrane metalloprotease [Pseudoclavibacter chungangensis]|uniref:CPBP family intramembrane metalloprotease n=1 Tax=Pseudoclavibacter chungangensis TaxID=587635 RepID=A0A7J5BQD5_9MICO|nr:CPBP family intramembrane glutamic endopeptidase [Pseudoclavibacter chungangensis]KAB1656018.1 CPBP family intramembrane metalloprotease [Pseudoclavibacter chungangensis]NYJ66474.1 hypothetical protein [Pseudoclavibacter chungangensis]
MTAPATTRDVGAWTTVLLALLAAGPILVLSFGAADDGGVAVSAWALLLGAVWFTGGGIVLAIRRQVDRDDSPPRPARHRVLTSLLAGAALATASLVGGLVLSSWPATAPLVAAPLAAAASQPVALLLAVAFVTGAAEEVFFRLAFPTLLRGWWRWIVPTVLYAIVTLCSGTPALALMAAVLGVVAMWTLDRTRWWPAPIIVHAVWTVAMIGIFPVLVGR